jgi:tRNA (guanine-N7-)-methyltransferase
VTDDNVTELRSFGRRRGRKASDRQDALKRDLLPKVALDLTSPPPPHGDGAAWVGEIPNADAARELWLEIGFGGGEHLVWQATHNPSTGFIGCEPFEDGVVKVLTAIDEAKIGNIRLHMGDARDVLRWLAPCSISRAFILFPDPWPKRKHRKRRLVNAGTLALLARVMKPGAELRIGTDIGDYARTMLEAFRAQQAFAWQAESPGDWRIRPSDWPPTRYEQKAEREGRRRYYFRFLRTGA